MKASKIFLLSLLLCISYSCNNVKTYNEVNNITGTNPDFPFKGEMFTGFIVIDNATQSNLYYHLYAFNQTNISASAPLIIWFQGGPGCSSCFGNFDELGPVSVLGTPTNITLNANPYGWTNFAHLMFIDQPTGTGWSVANGLNVSTTWQAAVHINIFLARFYQLFPMLQSKPLYLFGESYAGKYVPVFAYTLLQNATFSSQVKIVGIGVGDGWSDPLVQGRTYSTLGWAAGFVSENARDKLKLGESNSTIDLLNGNNWLGAMVGNIVSEEQDIWGGNLTGYDYRDYSSDNGEYENWLNESSTQDFLCIPRGQYEDCNNEISDNFMSDQGESISWVYTPLIENIKVLWYNGQDDNNCDYEGVYNYITELNWTHIKDFRCAERKIWHLSNGSIGGYVKNYGSATQLLILKSGHYVPFFQPAIAAEMVYNFLNDIPFN